MWIIDTVQKHDFFYTLLYIYNKYIPHLIQIYNETQTISTIDFINLIVIFSCLFFLDFDQN